MNEVNLTREDRIPLPSDTAVAIITLDDGRFLLQLRDEKTGIPYPGHWGLFGGSAEKGETAIEALHRELGEELGLAPESAAYFTALDCDYGFVGCGMKRRTYFVVPLRSASLSKLILTEGAGMRAFMTKEVLRDPLVIPLDAYAIWLYINRDRMG